MADRYPIRPATPADLAGMALLEEAAFSDPWSSTMIAEAITAPGAVALVATDSAGRVVGSVLGRTVADESEILTIAVTPTLRRQGLGRRLLDATVARLDAAGAATIWLEVRTSNLAARRMYQAAGFVATGVRRGYYRRPTEDAVILKRGVPASPGSDPEVRSTPNGGRVATLSLATSRQWKGSDGQRQEKTQWHRVVCWNAPRGQQLADIAERYCKKGEKVYIEGEIEYRTWQDKEGQTRYSTEINCRELILLGSRGGGDDDGSSWSGSRSAAPAKSSAAPAGGKKDESFDDFPDALDAEDDDLPF